MENIKVNSVIIFENEDPLKKPDFERVLWIDIAFDKMILININDPKALPYVREISDMSLSR